MRATIAYRVRGLAEHIWESWGLDEVRWLSQTDLAVIGVVRRIYLLADRLDRPY